MEQDKSKMGGSEVTFSIPKTVVYSALVALISAFVGLYIAVQYLTSTVADIKAQNDRMEARWQAASDNYNAMFSKISVIEFRLGNLEYNAGIKSPPQEGKR